MSSSPHISSFQSGVDQSYVIPTAQPKMGWLSWFVAVPALGGLAVGLYMGAKIDDALMLGVIGFFCGIPLLIIAAVIAGFSQLRVQKAVWAKHTFAWYRETFPAHAHPNGHVSCRHCGSHKTNVRNLMNRTFMRVHSCSQCGETLYYSPEKV